MRNLLTTLALVGCACTAHAAAQHLLLKEVVAAPSAGEYIAVFNPNATTVDLTDYYVSDSSSYYLVVTGLSLDTGDFVARFPANASIATGETQFIAISGATNFIASYGVGPNYELVALETQTADMVVVAQSGTASLTNAGEPVVLFYWDGTTNLVTDVDYVYYGTPAGVNSGVNKTGVTINGDSYLPDTADSSTLHAPVTAGTSIATCRKDFAETGQTSSGGNGVGDTDQTSEPSSSTWVACPFSLAPDRIFANAFEP